MLNQVNGVGRIVTDLKIAKENEKLKTNILIAVPRSYKNDNGEFETDLLKIELWQQLAQNICEYCKKGDLVGIKGRLQNDKKNIIVYAEKVTFLASGKAEE